LQTARALLFITLALLSQARPACAQAGAPQAPARPDEGVLDGSAYTNEYFGLTLTLPKGWKTQGEAAKRDFKEKGRRLIDPKDPAKQASLDRAVSNTLSLLTASQHPLGAPVHFNPMFVCAAEKIPDSAAGATDADYMAVLKKTLAYSQAPVTIDRDVYTESVGGETFSVIDITITFPDAVGRQRLYTHIRRGYALSFILIYLTDEQLRALKGVVGSVRFR